MGVFCQRTKPEYPLFANPSMADKFNATVRREFRICHTWHNFDAQGWHLLLQGKHGG